MSLRICPYEGKCCMRKGKECVALADTYFRDGECHFQKRTRYGVNVYDAIRRAKNDKR